MAKVLEKIDDTYCEAFKGLVLRLLITADTEYGELEKAARSCTSLPSIVVGRTEGGIEKWLSKEETPDEREGAILQLWGMVDEHKPLEESLNRFVKDVAIRIRQGILVVPTTAVFNALDSKDLIDIMPWVGKCGGDYEEVVEYQGRDGVRREMINVPIMMGCDFRIERRLGYTMGISGANLWFLCESTEAGLRIGYKALKAIDGVEGVVTPFGVCSAGSKPDDYPLIGPTTNHWYCPTLRGKIPDSKVPENVESIPEIVINGLSISAVKEAMAVAIEAVMGEEGLVKISAGNYGGKLGQYKIFLRKLVK